MDDARMVRINREHTSIIARPPDSTNEIDRTGASTLLLRSLLGAPAMRDKQLAGHWVYNLDGCAIPYERCNAA